MASSTKAAASDVEPGPKRRRLLDAGGPIEDDETARQKMRDATVYERGVDGTGHGTWGEYVGFDPDNVADVKSCRPKIKQDITPMGYFAHKGDLPMMRRLYVNGADTRDVDVALCFPMYWATIMARMEVCKWLFAHGAAKDVKRRTRDDATNYSHGRSPLHVAFGRSRDLSDLSRWLILNGALCKDGDSGDLDIEIMKQDLSREGYDWLAKQRRLLLKWAIDLHRARSSFLLFLSGALSRPKHACSTRQNVSPLRLLAGKSGIFETIGDYVGIVRGREARIIRQLTEMLSKLIAELQVDTDRSGESSSDE